MKKVLVSMLFLVNFLLGQEDFKFPIYFEDAVGHRDTVYFGYDSSATDSIDHVFGETDITNSPWDTALDVRLSGVRVWQGYGLNYRYPYQTKKLIADPLCGVNASIFTIKILTRHWPITARWDSTSFQGPCRSTHTFSSIISDALGDSRRVINGVKGGYLGFIKFGEVSRITFSEQRYGRYEYFYEVSADPTRIDTVNLFWVSLNRAAFDRLILPISETNKKIPLPMLTVAGDQLMLLALGMEVFDIQLFSLSGRKIVTKVSDRYVDMSSLKTGIYLLTYANGTERFERKIFRQ